MSRLNGQQFGSQNARWYQTRDSGERWLEVLTETRQRGLTDGASARDFVGAGSWEHHNPRSSSSRVYLAEGDAQKWFDHVGSSDSDMQTFVGLRRPNGSRARNLSAAIVDGSASPDAVNDFFGRMEAEAYDPSDAGPDVDSLEYDPRQPF